MPQHENEKYLMEQGYKYDRITGRYVVIFEYGSYKAGNAIELFIALDAPLHYIKAWHENFIRLAKQKHNFNE